MQTLVLRSLLPTVKTPPSSRAGIKPGPDRTGPEMGMATNDVGVVTAKIIDSVHTASYGLLPGGEVDMTDRLNKLKP